MEEEESIPSKPNVYVERGRAAFKMGFYDERKEERDVHHPLQSAASPAPSYVSLKSDRSMAEPPKFSDKAEYFQPSLSEKKEDCDVHYQFQRAASSLPSYGSLKSDRSMAEPPKFSDKVGHLQASGKKKHVDQDQPTCLSGDFDCFQCSYQPIDGNLQRIKNSHKTSMKNKYESLFEGINIQENKTLLNKIYTQLYIIEGESEGVNEEHEVVQIEKARTERLQGTPINCNDIFHPISDPSYERKNEKENVKTVLTKGIAGIGKTVSVQKFILDWAEGKANQDIEFLFVLPFRELNLVKDDQYSLHRLLLDFHPELPEFDTKIYDSSKVLFIFDGLDESRITLTFLHCEKVSDVSTTSSMSMLMSNLIKGELLPSALIWITSRPAAASLIPSHYISRVTEVQGFNDLQKEEYFRKRISDQHQASRIISHIRTARSLHIMCHIPVFCWISATVLQNILKQDHSAEIPKTLTEMYIHFLIIQADMKKKKYGERNGKDPKLLLQSERDVILKLAELAFKALMNGDVLFYDEDLKECGIDVNDALVYSGICTEIFKEESVICSRKVYCFVHLSFQEFFAALFLFDNYLNKNSDVLKMFKKKKGRGKLKSQSSEVSLDAFLKVAVDEALKSENGHLDLFLRFLHGISLESNQRLLQGLLTHMEDNPESMKKVIKNLKQSQKQNVRPERWINLSHCLIEMKDTSILEYIQAFLKPEGKEKKNLSSTHCSALANMLLMAEDVLEELNLKKYNTKSIEAQRRLVPAVRNCRKALLAGCNLTEQSCETVASALQPANSPVRELDMSNNDLQDSGVKLISLGLKSSHCKLEILRLKCCKLTIQSCESVASALLSANSCLRELDLSNNDLQDSGLKLLAAGLKSPHCKLEILSLAGSKLTDQSCETLGSVLQSMDSCLRELDLSNNNLKDSGLEWLSAGLNSCKVEKLRLASCNLTGQSCEMISSTLQSVNCLLKELDMSNNDLQDLGVEIFSAGLKSPHCKLEILRMSICNLTGWSCATVASVVQSANCPLRELNLSKNDLQDSGVEMLSDGLKSSHCKLEILRLSGCCITAEGCSVLASALTSNPSYLRELDLSCNHPGELGGQVLLARVNDPTCKLEILNLEHEGQFRITAGLRRYAQELTLDPNTAHTHLFLSEGSRTVTHVEETQSYPDHPERFECYPQVLCRESLSECCSWEVEWSGKSGVYVSVSYKGIRRKGETNDCEFGSNEKSWRLICSDNSFSAWHNNERTKMRPPSSSSRSKRVGVYLDWPAGTLSFYCISDTNRVTHLHTFHSTFPEPLYAGFGLYSGSSVSLCQIETSPVGKNSNNCGNGINTVLTNT
ncbi:NACHT, LRR and PYD domains-containing protein 12 isoform X2 [Megalobrama amblycephala]|uniref:NACHT, LRR and PYD domains-containing protein 12 isoform X2 n=1 Tax=Megalobrama amblycephala TaxID=75352 RepID=UPI002013CDF4|nr:NACHT, LRR and PYD domains-containing protein 12 isoform X2 [Megalobrama amblycephala]